jgi:hypothetical protein
MSINERKCLKVEYLCQIEYYFQNSCVTGPWNHEVSVSAKKKSKNKFNACVPLTAPTGPTSLILHHNFFSRKFKYSTADAVVKWNPPSSDGLIIAK